MAEEALVIIDVQKGFNPCASIVENSVLKLVERAKASGHAIFVVGLRRCGPTVLPIQRALRGYPLVYRVRKYGQDGGLVLARAIHRAWERGDVQHFSKVQFCGLYTSMCVRDTFLTLCRIAASSRGVEDRTALSRATKLVLNGHACTEGDGGYNSIALRNVRREQVGINRKPVPLKFRRI